MAENNAINFGEEFDKQEFGLIDDGKYEVELSKIEARTSAKTNNQYLNLTFTIRKDVEQKFGGRKLFYTIGKKEGDSCFDFTRINKLILTQKGRADYKTRFLDFDEVLLYLNGIHLVLTVETNFDDYRGEDRNEIKDWSFEPSVWDTTTHVSQNANAGYTTVTPATSGNGTSKVTPNISDDLPF